MTRRAEVLRRARERLARLEGYDRRFGDVPTATLQAARRDVEALEQEFAEREERDRTEAAP